MPRYWHDKHIPKNVEVGTVEFNRSIVADKKPYFMRYIYPALMKEYNEFISNTNKNSLREFGLTVDELMEIPEHKQTRRQKEFLKFYKIKMPVGTNDCIMNKICRKVEEAFSKDNRYNFKKDFDFSILKSDAGYSQYTFYKIKDIVEGYNYSVKNYSIMSENERVKKEDSKIGLEILLSEFKRNCEETCPNAEILCNILIDLCYKKTGLKKIIWGMCGDEIVATLLSRNNNIIEYPTECPDGEIYYAGNRYTIKQKEVL